MDEMHTGEIFFFPAATLLYIWPSKRKHDDGSNSDSAKFVLYLQLHVFLLPYICITCLVEALKVMLQSIFWFVIFVCSAMVWWLYNAWISLVLATFSRTILLRHGSGHFLLLLRAWRIQALNAEESVELIHGDACCTNAFLSSSLTSNLIQCGLVESYWRWKLCFGSWSAWWNRQTWGRIVKEAFGKLKLEHVVIGNGQFEQEKAKA